MSAYLYYPSHWVIGTNQDDYLPGTDGGEVILGFAGNDHLRGYGGADSLYGDEGNDVLEGGAGNDRLEGGDGLDTASYFNTSHGVIANLVFGTARTLGAGPVDDDTLIGIENLSGSFYADHFQGDDQVNRLDGNAGDDVLMGWGGSDVLNGGFGVDYVIGGDGHDTISGGFDNDTLQGNAGYDTVDYSYAYQGMFVSLNSGQSRSLNSGYYVDVDSLSGFENVTGTAYDDVLEGDNTSNILTGASGHDRLTGFVGNDLLDGGDGDDVLDGGEGADRFQGGSGTDTVYYRFSANAVGIDLSTGSGVFGDALFDTYIDMENIVGSDHASGDVLKGSTVGNQIYGLDGNDAIYGLGGNDFLYGGDGIDYLDGGDGFDTAGFAPSSGGVGPIGPGVVVNLSAGTVMGLGNDGERISNIEAVIGTSFEDVIIGNGADNTLSGGANHDTLIGAGGSDSLWGEAGSDRLRSGLGADYLNGGDDLDTAEYTDSAVGVVVNLTTGQGSGGTAEGDALVLVENLTGSRFADTLIGDGLGNTLIGGRGADTLRGLGGNDFYYVDDAGDVVDEVTAGSSGTDTVLSTLSHSLRTNIENLILLGTDAISGIGNARANTLTGNAAANVLTGGGGADTMIGGGGADTFRYAAVSDSTSGARDLIRSFAAEDQIDLSLLDANTSGGTANDAFQFVSTLAAAQGTAGSLFLGPLSGTERLAYLNTDADSTIEMVIRIQGTVTTADFTL